MMSIESRKCSLSVPGSCKAHSTGKVRETSSWKSEQGEGQLFWRRHVEQLTLRSLSYSYGRHIQHLMYIQIQLLINIQIQLLICIQIQILIHPNPNPNIQKRWRIENRWCTAWIERLFKKSGIRIKYKGPVSFDVFLAYPPFSGVF